MCVESHFLASAALCSTSKIVGKEFEYHETALGQQSHLNNAKDAK